MLNVTLLMDQYGYLVLFGGLFLELIALPVPGEVLMSYCGLLIFEGRLNWLVSVLMAGAGSSLGMLLAYLIGYKLGVPFFQRYGRKIHLGPERLAKTSFWFQRYGNKLLIIGFFIPGVRHITGYFAGITRIPIRTVVMNVILGAYIWTGTFISLGKVLGPKWEQYQGAIKKYLIIAGVIAGVVLMMVYMYRKYRKQIFAMTTYTLKNFQSLGRARFLVASLAVVFLSLFVFMIGLIQDFLAHEFTEFDSITSYIVQSSLDDTWVSSVSHLSLMAAPKVAFVFVFIVVFWIWRNRRDKKIETGFLLIASVGGEVLEEILRRLFHRLGPLQNNLTFPSEQTMVILTIYGMIIYLLMRQVPRLRIAFLLGLLAVSILNGLSRIFYNLDYPSDVVGGIEFAGVWLSLNFILLEIFTHLNDRTEFRNETREIR